MLFKHITPIAASLRNKIVVNRQRSKKFKGLFISNMRSQGRTLNGQITSRGKGGGNLFQYRNTNYSSIFLKLPGIFLGYDFDNYRTGWLGLIKYINGCYGYILAADNMKIGSFVNSYNDQDNIRYLKLGDRAPILKIPKGSWIYNISLNNCTKGKLIKSAGTAGYVKSHDFAKKLTLVKLPSKKFRNFNDNCYASFGRVSNGSHFLEHYSKAGVRYIFNYRPKVRGEAMNAVDHHHGGKTKGGKTPKTPWGKIVKK